MFINFDGLRHRIFPSDVGSTPKGAKIVCMYALFLCDWYVLDAQMLMLQKYTILSRQDDSAYPASSLFRYWVVLMYSYRSTIGWQQIVGSAFDIMLRLPFAFRPANMFKKSVA